jgi:predicted kinase
MYTLYLLRGLPGAGKSTLAKSICSGKESTLHFEADQYFTSPDGTYNFDPTKIKQAHEYCKKSTLYAMEDGVKDIVVSNTFTQGWEMEAYYKMAEELGYRVFSLIVENRHGGENIHTVPKETIKKMKDRFKLKL